MRCAGLLLLVLTACVGKVDGTAAFVEQVDAACAQTQRALQAIPSPSSASQTADYIAATVAANRTGVERLRVLRPPSALAADHAALVRAAEDAVAAFVDVAEAGDDGTEKARATRALEGARERFNAGASALGAARCITAEQTVSPSPSAR